MTIYIVGGFIYRKKGEEGGGGEMVVKEGGEKKRECVGPISSFVTFGGLLGFIILLFTCYSRFLHVFPPLIINLILCLTFLFILTRCRV